MRVTDSEISTCVRELQPALETLKGQGFWFLALFTRPSVENLRSRHFEGVMTYEPVTHLLYFWDLETQFGHSRKTLLDFEIEPAEVQDLLKDRENTKKSESRSTQKRLFLRFYPKNGCLLFRSTWKPLKYQWLFAWLSRNLHKQDPPAFWLVLGFPGAATSTNQSLWRSASSKNT